MALSLPGRSLEQIAESIGRGTEFTAAVLRELDRDGIVEQLEDGWRLTPEAEARYGPAIRFAWPLDGCDGARC